jgi:hypothetical protein
MKLQHRYVLLGFCSLLGCAGASSAATPSVSPAPSAQGTPLDGQSFDVMLEIPDAPAVKDTLRFANGKFESTACTTLGFPEWSDYSTRPSPDAVVFHVLTHHPSGTTMNWNGTVKGAAVDGTAKRTMNGKTDVLAFKGLLRP